ncbi:RNA polymerase sigma factor [Pontibacter oryzae]|uniref:Sigma-70 family RNA polymerase sigma factor n=1 Tax=Pontibacter oryzae TaxID=2304593 RepID=A0A399SGS7_9BACT|nr:sigma-70 family RNA polymerase sigma factor [Pontibacter oryzae]RIJ42418.1 sigma-70 family RNA polymerase sigma factor [Pontibacter oryzae]
MEELEVWLRFREGSEADFTLLYKRYAPVMLRYGNKLTTDPDLVKDCIQQVFFQIWKSRENLSNPPSVKNYLLKSFRHELGKKATFKSKHEPLPEDISLGAEASHESELINSQSFELVQKKVHLLLAKLPERQREVIFLKYYTGLQYDEISDIMGIDQKSVYKLTYKAIDKLHRLFSEKPQPARDSLRKRMSGLASGLQPAGTQPDKLDTMEPLSISSNTPLLLDLSKL